MYGMEEPTWINVAREPVSRFVSSYYFRRYGFNRHTGARNKNVLEGKFKMDMVRSWKCMSMLKRSVSRGQSR